MKILRKIDERKNSLIWGLQGLLEAIILCRQKGPLLAVIKILALKVRLMVKFAKYDVNTIGGFCPCPEKKIPKRDYSNIIPN